jgi:hypothetical protein
LNIPAGEPIAMTGKKKSLRPCEEREVSKRKKTSVIARIPNDEVDRDPRQSAKEGLPEENLSLQIAPQSGMQKTHFTGQRSQ